MRINILSSMLIAMLMASTHVYAQDDMYFTPSKKNVEEAKKARAAAKKAQEAGVAGMYYSGINKTDDEYNRRTRNSATFAPYEINDGTLYSSDSIASDIIEFSIGDEMTADSARTDTVYKYIILDDEDYMYSRRMSRFDDFYWWNRFYGPSYWSRPIGWYTGWYGCYYDPWYAGWYDPWFYGHHHGWWAGGPYWGFYPGWHHNHHIGGGMPSGGNRSHAFAGTSNHKYTRTTGGNSYAIANRNGDKTTRHRGAGYRGNDIRSNSRYDNTFNSSRQPSYSGSRNYNAPSYSAGGNSGGGRGGHTGGFGGGSRSGGSFGGGRR